MIKYVGFEKSLMLLFCLFNPKLLLTTENVKPIGNINSYFWL